MKKRSEMKSRENCYEDEDPSVGCGCCIKSHPHLDSLFGSIAEESTIHGVKYIGSKKLHLVERLFWTVVMLTSLGFSIYLVKWVFSKFDTNPVIISFQPQETLVSQIPFPAITICNVNLLKTSELIKEIRRLEHLLILNKYNETAYNLTTEILEGISNIDHMSQTCLATPSFRRSLNETMQDANGFPDFIQRLSDNIIQYLSDSDTHRMHQIQRTSKFWRGYNRLFKKIAVSCEDMLIKCMWAGDMVPCNEIFFHIDTRSGHCCVFNMMPKFILQNISHDDWRAQKEIKAVPNETIDKWIEFGHEDLIIKNLTRLEEIDYPKHQKAGGKPYGLTVLTNPGLMEYSTCTTDDAWGFKIVAHSSLSSPSMEYGAAVPPSSEVFVDIEPRVTVVADKDKSTLTGIPVKTRGCYMPSDKRSHLANYNYYSSENCFSECWARYTFRNCSCVRSFMPRNMSQKVCGAKNATCANEVRANLTRNFGKKGFCSSCIAPCTDVKYKLHISHFDMREDNASSFLTYNNSEGERNATNYSIIHFYIGTDAFYAKERKMLYDWVDLLANAGGLLGLTLGVSIVSGVEIFYFFTLRFWFQFRSVPKDRNDNEDVDQDGTYESRKQSRRRSSSRTLVKKNDGYYSWAVRNKFHVPGGSHGGAQGKHGIIF